MAFPQDVLGNKVEIYYDGEWHDITEGKVRGVGAEDGEITISPRGEPDEATALQPTQATLSLNNRDGMFSPRNAHSSLYGKIGTNTPLRIATDFTSTKSIVDTFSGTRTNTWGTTDTSGHTWVNTTSGSANDFDVAGGVGTHSLGANNVPHFSSITTTVGGDPLSITDFDVLVEGITPSAAASGDNIEVGVWGRLSGGSFVEARLLFNPGKQVLIAVREIVNSVEVGNTGFVVIAGAVSTDTMSFRFEAIGGTIRMRAWETANTEPTTWQRELAVTYTTPGTMTLFSTLHAGNANAKPFVVSFNRFYASLGVVLFTGEVVEWPKRWDSTGNDVWVPLVAAGITRRLRQGNRPIRSPLYRYLTVDLATEEFGIANPDVDHYWPMEDLAQQTRDIRCEIDGESILRLNVAVHNSVEWGSNDFVVGSGKLVTVTGLPIPEGVVVVPFISSLDAPPLGGGYFPTPDVDSPQQWTFVCWFYWPPLLDSFPFLPATSLYFSFAVPDSTIANVFVDVQYRPDTATFSVTLASTSGDLANGPVSMDYTDEPHLFVAHWFTDTATNETQFSVFIDNNNVCFDTASFRPFAHIRRFDVEIEPYSPITIGHIALQTNGASNPLLAAALSGTLRNASEGFPGESAVDRFERLCNTQGVAYEVVSVQDDIDFPTVMGPQRPGNFIDHLDDISFADGGVIYELRTPFGYGFRTRSSLYGAAADLTLDYANGDLGEVPTVTGDDQKTRNIVRAKLRGGTQGEITGTVTSGPLGTAIAGDYEDGGIEVALDSTAQLQEWIDWALFLGTWDEDRWPDLTLHLHRPQFYNSVQKFVDALRLEIGQLLRINNPPEWVTDASVVQQMRAVAITLSNFNLSLSYTMLPGGPYALPQLNNTDADRADIESCYLVSSVDSDDTDLIVTTYMTQTPVDTPLWTTDPAEFDSWGHDGIGLRLNPVTRAGGTGGERVVAGSPAPVRDTFSRVASQLGGSNADTGQTWVNTAGTATAWTVNGSAAPALHTAASTDYWSTIPVGEYDHSVSVSVAFNFTTATGGQFITDVMLRQVDTSNNYYIRLILDTGSSTVLMQVRKVVGGAGTLIAGNYTIGTNVAGTPVNIRGSIVGRTFKAKAWISGTEEPEWTYIGWDAASDAVNGTNVGLRSIRLVGNTNVNATSTWDNFQVQTPKIRPVFWDHFAYTMLNNPDGAFPDDLTYPTTYNWFTAGFVEADIDFTPNQLQITGSTTNAYGAVYLDQLNYLDAVVSVVWTAPSPVTGGDLEPGGVMMRGTLITEYILFRPYITADNQMFARIYSRTGVQLGQMYVPPDAHRSDRPMVTKAACFGDQLMMKVWCATDTEPTSWGLVVTDPDPQSGWIGLRAGRSSANTNANAAMTYHNFRVENPQRITVVRSANGVVKSWEAGTDVRLYSPMILGR